MSDEQLPPEADVTQVSWKLHESLKVCQAMVANYRLMLGHVANDNQPRGVEGGGSFVVRTTEAEEA